MLSCRLRWIQKSWLVREGYVFQSSVVQFCWACANRSLSFLFLADRSGTRCGQEVIWVTVASAVFCLAPTKLPLRNNHWSKNIVGSPYVVSQTCALFIFFFDLVPFKQKRQETEDPSQHCHLLFTLSLNRRQNQLQVYLCFPVSPWGL